MTITKLVTLTKQIVTSVGFCNSPEDVRPIVEHISAMNPSLLGLENHPYNMKKKKKGKGKTKSNQINHQSNQEGLDTILYQHIFEDEHISVGIFILPKNAVLPLHDHPSMSVVTLGLFGSCRVMSYDWKTPEARQAQEGEAVLVLNKILSAGDVAVCHPTSHGNIHSIHATENFAMLDILIPPYGENRLCQYFMATPLPEVVAVSSPDSNGAAEPAQPIPGEIHWLKPIPEPFLPLEHELYLGPPVDITKLKTYVVPSPVPNPQSQSVAETAQQTHVA